MKCTRCGKKIAKSKFCQTCKNILLPYFEKTNDWQQAHEMESLQRSISKYSNAASDIEELSF